MRSMVEGAISSVRRAKRNLVPHDGARSGIGCASVLTALSFAHIRPLRVGSLNDPERYRNPGAFFFRHKGGMTSTEVSA
jgi:hypothetical protein